MVDSFKESDLFKGLSEEQRNDAITSGSRKKIQSNSILFHQGDPAANCFLVIQGRLKLSILSEDGKEVIIRYISTGEATAAVTVLKNWKYPATATSVEKSEIVMWNRPGLTGMMERFPAVAINMLHIVLKRLDDLQRRYLELCTEQVEQRIARALLRFMNRAGSKSTDGILIQMPLSRQTIAEYTGTTIYTVSRTLSKWEKEGFIKSRRETIVIINPHALVTLTENQ